MKTFLKTWAPLLVVAVVLVLAFVFGPERVAFWLGGAGMAMAVGFNSIPNNLRVPFTTVEIDNSRAIKGPVQLAYRALIIGQKTAAGTAGANTFVRVSSASQAQTAAGRGSQLHRMAIAWFKSNKTTEVWLGVLADNGAGVLATKTITFTGPATAAGTISLYVGGELVQVAVASGDSVTTVAAAVAAAVTANLDLAVSATSAVGVVTTTARNKGTVGQDLDIRVNYQPEGEATPAGLTVVIAAATSGITNPSLTALIAAMGDTWYQVIAHPYTDATSLTAIEAELHDRFGPMRMIDGVAITATLGSQSVMGTLGDTRNSQHSFILSEPGENPITPPSEYAAEAAAVVAFYGSIDPARPFQTLALVHTKSPAEADLFTLQERNLLLYDGVSTSKVVAGTVQLERIVSTYQLNSAGGPDESFLDLNTLLTLMYLRYSFRAHMQQAFPRHKLADDGTPVASGQAIVTPMIFKAECVAWFMNMLALGLVEGLEQFKRDLVVERNVTNRNRIDALLPPDLINQLMTTAGQIQFGL